MSATQMVPGTLYGIEKINIKALNTQYEVVESIWLDDIFKLPITSIIEQGTRVVDKADGVGVIDVHEEDDTLIGADMTIEHSALNVALLHMTIGGDTETDQYGGIVSYKMPTIKQQRDNLKRFELDVYVESSNFGDTAGYLRHRFFYCSGSVPGFRNNDAQFSAQNLTVKARPRPDTGDVHKIDFLSEIPN